ncbi:MAG: toxin TcdB middle/N-terminal domain-containing protein [bacterium]
MFSTAAFCIDDYDPDKVFQIPHQNILNNESFPGTTGNTGALTFSIPIKVPPGAGGLQPELALTYNSNSKQNNWVGLGWSLDFGSIKRSSKKRINFDSNDTFVYNDSVELFKCDPYYNSNYNYFSARIEGDFKKFKYLNYSSGSKWEVQAPDGKKYYYGSSDNSKIKGDKDISIFYVPGEDRYHVTEWFLDKIEDANGNSITIQYDNSDNGVYLKQINYIPSGTSVKFILEDRDDIHPVFNNYRKIEVTKRLKEIQVYGGAVPAYKYKFEYNDSGYYGSSILTSVREYGANFDSTVFPATTFQYESGPSFSFESEQSTNVGSANSALDTRFADINGDGFIDLIKLPLYGNGKIFLGNKDGNFGPAITSNLSPANYDHLGFLHFNDVNGDGRADFIAKVGYVMKVYLASATQVGMFTYSGETDLYGLVDVGNNKMADANGDGLPDLIEFPSTGNQVRVHLSDGAGGFVRDIYGSDVIESYTSSYNTGKIHMADVNGDGLADKICYSSFRTVDVHLANGDGTYGTPGGNCGYSGYPLACGEGIETILDAAWESGLINYADVNGDGFSDIVLSHSGYDRSIYTYFSDGFGGFVKADQIATASECENVKGYVFLDDINGDGLADLIKTENQTYNNAVHYYLGNGAGDFEYQGSFNKSHRGFCNILDVNGDKLADFVGFGSGYTNVYTHLANAMSSSGFHPDLLVGIDNGYGVTSTINYKLSTSYPSVHKSAEYPNAHLPFVTELVDSITINDGIGNSAITTTYDYFGAHYSVEEKEFFGLQRIVKTNPNNTVQTSDYEVDDYYLKGRVSTTCYADNASSDQNTTSMIWSKFLVQTSTQPCSAWEPNCVQEEKGVLWVRPEQVNSTIISGGSSVTSNVSYGYNYSSGFGYANSITKSGSGASNHVEQNAYGNYGEWIWRLTDNSIQQDGVTARHTNYQYDGAGNLIIETHDNNIGSDAVILRDYDGYGNVISETDPNGSNTTLTYLYGTYLSSKNFEGLITTYSNFNQWGQAKTITDENSHITAYTYDDYGRVTNEDYPGPGYKEVVYSDSARPRYTIDRVYDGSGTFADTYKYIDGLDRVLQTTQRGISGANSTMRYYYDGAGRNWQTTGPFFTSDFSYASSSPAGVPVICQIPVVLFAELQVIRFGVFFDVLPN